MCARLAPAASRVASRRLVRPRFPAAAVARHSLIRQAAVARTASARRVGLRAGCGAAPGKGLRACTLISAGCAGCSRALQPNAVSRQHCPL